MNMSLDFEEAPVLSSELEKLKNNIATAVNESSSIVVLTESDVATASVYISNYKKLEREIESMRKAMTQPLLDKKAEIDSFFKNIKEKYSNELTRLSNEVIEFKRKVELEAKRKADEERRKLEEEALEIAIREGRDEPPIIPEVIPTTKKISEMNSAKISSRRTKTFRIIDATKIPREYLMPDEKKIRAERMKYDFDAKSNIPGVEFGFEETVV